VECCCFTFSANRPAKCSQYVFFNALFKSTLIKGVYSGVSLRLPPPLDVKNVYFYVKKCTLTFEHFWECTTKIYPRTPFFRFLYTPLSQRCHVNEQTNQQIRRIAIPASRSVLTRTARRSSGTRKRAFHFCSPCVVQRSHAAARKAQALARCCCCC